jgi:hypothetical protein
LKEQEEEDCEAYDDLLQSTKTLYKEVFNRAFAK